MKYVKSTYVFKGITVTNTWMPSDTLEKFRPIAQVYGIVFNKSGSILVCKEKPDQAWQLPGGTPERNEEPSQTLSRELKEEVDTSVSNIKPLGVQKVSMLNSPNKRVGNLFYQARMVALLDKQHKQTPDPATGNIWKRKFVPATKVNEYIKWGKFGEAMFSDAIKLFKNIKKN